MKKVVLITGANGTLAKKLAILLEGKFEVRFLTRKLHSQSHYLWDIDRNYIDPKALIDVHHIIHLAGSPIANKRWTRNRKQIIRSSRIDGANLILSELERHQVKIDSFFSASAIGYYGTENTKEVLNEESPKGIDFLSEVCNDWELAAKSFELNRVARRVVILRMGIIISKDGALKKITRMINSGFGSSIGTGNQWMPWIHISDLCKIFEFFLENKSLNGTFNAVSPEHVSNEELTRKTAILLRRKLILPKTPRFIIKILFGELSTILINGNKVSSEKIQKIGFEFKYEKIEHALNNVLKD